MDDGRHLGIILPGRGYGHQGPVLHLPRLALEQTGAITAVIDYGLDGDSLPDGAGWDDLHASVQRQVDDLVHRHRPQRLTFVAKSLGTVALADLHVEHHHGDRIEAIWITPLWGRDDVRAGAMRLALRSLVVAGAVDPLHDAAGHDEVCAAIDTSSLVLAGADHSLEVAGDVSATLEAYRQLTEAVERFIGWPSAR